MSARPEAYDAALSAAVRHARSWLASLPDRPVRPRLTADELATGLAAPLPDGPTDPAEVVDLLAGRVEPGLMAMPSGRFFGWVIGGTLPAALAADWLVSAWDQNTGDALRDTGHRRRRGGRRRLAARPARAARRTPPSASSPAATMANFTGLAAGRQQRARPRPAGTSTGSG